MATRSFISIMGEDGCIRGVYCHSDGYPAGVGRMLKEHYSDMEKIIELIGLGSLSKLGPRLWPVGDEHHSYSRPAQGVVVAYYRDRGELPWVPPSVYDSLEDALKYVRGDCGAEWLYVWDGEQWNFHQAS